MPHYWCMGTDSYVDWRTKSQCSKLDSKLYDEIFYPKSGRSKKRAKLLCDHCSVSSICLEIALDNNEHGIWAGTTEKERMLIQRTRNRRIVPQAIVVSRKTVKRTGFRFSA